LRQIGAATSLFFILDPLPYLRFPSLDFTRRLGTRYYTAGAPRNYDDEMIPLPLPREQPPSPPGVVSDTGVIDTAVDFFCFSE